MKLARRLIAVPLVIFAVLSTATAPSHSVDPEWSAHDQIHLVTGMIWLLGLCLVGVLLAWGPLERRERWAWWTLLAIGLLVFAAPILTAWAYAPAALAGSVDLIGSSLLGAAYGLGLVLAWRRW